VAGESSVKTIKVLGGFELIQKIGQGGMGTVLKARQISLDRVVALKVLPPKIAQKEPAYVERFIREARTSAKLNHPNIVQGIEVGKDEATGLYFFAMELIDGPTVKALLKQQRVLEEKRALEIALGVTQALICAHRAGIVHRDIKPDNILLTSRGEPKLADLGLARHALDNEDSEEEAKTSADDPFGLQQSSRKSDLTQAGSAVGTPSYMAPEQIRAEMDKIDARTDLYALGTTLFHMLTGKPPYAGANSKVVMAMHLTAPTPEARAVNSAISEATSKLVFKLMQKEQEKRYQSAEDVTKEIERILHGAPRPVIKSGKHSPVDTEKGNISHSSAESTAWRTHVASGGVKTSGRQKSQGVSKKLLYAGVGVAVIAAAGIVYMFVGGSKNSQPPVVVHKDVENKAPVQAPDVPAQPKTDPAKSHDPAPAPTASSSSSGGSSSDVASDAAKWPALERAIKYFNEHPTDYIAAIEKFKEAEKGAPVAMIPTIRHELYKVEHARDLVYQGLIDEHIKNAKSAIAGGSTDFASALAILQESGFPAGLTDGNKGCLAATRDEIEKMAVEAFKTKVEPGLAKEFETAGQSLTALEAFQNKLPAISKMYAVKPVRDALDAMNNNAHKRIESARGSLTALQDASYKRAVDTARSLTLNGDFQEALKGLNALGGDQGMAARYGGSIGVLTLDIQANQNGLKASIDTLNAKADKGEEISVHDLDGGTSFGKILQKNDKLNGKYLVQQGDKPQAFEVLKIDAEDVLQLTGQSVTGSERMYREAAYYFWRGKTAKAYDLFAKLKKDNAPEATNGAIYMAWMDSKASELINNITDLFTQVHSGKLSLDDAKQKQLDAGKLIVRLKTDFGTTEAYRAKHAKK
jgi:serine/threonine protein kinase